MRTCGDDLGHRRTSRVVCFIGGALLAATVVKLFLFDLSHVTGVGRIVSCSNRLSASA